MRRLAGACVVMVLIGAWNLTARWLVRPGAPSDRDVVVVAAAESSAAQALPVTSPPAHPAARGEIVIPSFERDPLAFLSTAPADSLDLLPGIGPVLARRIIEARAARGAFTSWDDVLAVKGIGPRTVARWRTPDTGQ